MHATLFRPKLVKIWKSLFFHFTIILHFLFHMKWNTFIKTCSNSIRLLPALFSEVEPTSVLRKGVMVFRCWSLQHSDGKNNTENSQTAQNHSQCHTAGPPLTRLAERYFSKENNDLTEKNTSFEPTYAFVWNIVVMKASVYWGHLSFESLRSSKKKRKKYWVFLALNSVFNLKMLSTVTLKNKLTG